jgi:hypothetical protein
VNDFRLAGSLRNCGEVDPSFANVYFNLALVQAINNELAAAVSTLTRYQELVCEEEARNADELLGNLKRSLAAARISIGNSVARGFGPLLSRAIYRHTIEK